MKRNTSLRDTKGRKNTLSEDFSQLAYCNEFNLVSTMRKYIGVSHTIFNKTKNHQPPTRKTIMKENKQVVKIFLSLDNNSWLSAVKKETITKF